MRIFALRLEPNLDLKESLKRFVSSNHIQAGFILTAIGSLNQVTIRFANQKTSNALNGKFEIIGLGGTLSISGVHIHIAVSDENGQRIGGHLEHGCIIYTTAEIVIGESKQLIFERELDRQTGFKELKVRDRLSQDEAKNLGIVDNFHLSQCF